MSCMRFNGCKLSCEPGYLTRIEEERNNRVVMPPASQCNTIASGPPTQVLASQFENGLLIPGYTVYNTLYLTSASTTYRLNVSDVDLDTGSVPNTMVVAEILLGKPTLNGSAGLPCNNFLYTLRVTNDTSVPVNLVVPSVATNRSVIYSESGSLLITINPGGYAMLTVKLDLIDKVPNHSVTGVAAYDALSP